jgi:diguanylate cyclase (GGDEF)-like protein
VDVAEKLRSAIGTHTPRASAAKFGGPLTALTVSIGVATFPEDSRSPSVLMERADAALYVAKGQGRDRVAVSTAPTQAETGATG